MIQILDQLSPESRRTSPLLERRELARKASPDLKLDPNLTLKRLLWTRFKAQRAAQLELFVM